MKFVYRRLKFIPMYTLAGFYIFSPPKTLPLSFQLTSFTFSNFKFLTFFILPIFLIFPISIIKIFPLILLHSSSRFILLTYFIPPRFTIPNLFPLLHRSDFFSQSFFFFSLQCSVHGSEPSFQFFPF